MRNMWTVQGPMPLTASSTSMISSSVIVSRDSRSSVPFTTRADRSLRYDSFCGETPAARSFLGSMRCILFASSSPRGKRALTFLIIADAAEPASCCERIDSTSDSKGSPSGLNSSTPLASRMGLSFGSRSRMWA